MTQKSAVRRHVYHPEFRGSFSIKVVLPALIPSLGYHDLDIREGSHAPVVFAEMIAAGTPPSRIAELRSQLLAYCKRDTLGMLELFRLLR